MNPLENRVEHLEKIIGMLVGSDRYTFQKHLQMLDGRNMQFGRTTGTKIATATDQKLAFFGATPVTRQSAITAPSGGTTVDTEARTAINSLITNNQTFGLNA